jgi:hypothetical protein
MRMQKNNNFLPSLQLVDFKIRTGNSTDTAYTHTLLSLLNNTPAEANLSWGTAKKSLYQNQM